jgi:hypothetical protein
MIQNYFQNVKTFLGSSDITARARVGWGKRNFSFFSFVPVRRKRTERAGSDGAFLRQQNGLRLCKSRTRYTVLSDLSGVKRNKGAAGL